MVINSGPFNTLAECEGGCVTCYRVTSAGVNSAGDCCEAGGCCNYEQSSIDSLLSPVGDNSWSVPNQGPAGTSTWNLSRNGNSWIVSNDCQAGCHIGMYTGSSSNWDGNGSAAFTMNNGYPTVTVTKELCPASTLSYASSSTTMACNNNCGSQCEFKQKLIAHHYPQKSANYYCEYNQHPTN